MLIELLARFLERRQHLSQTNEVVLGVRLDEALDTWPAQSLVRGEVWPSSTLMATKI